MKRIYINFIAVMTLSVVLFSCKKDEFVANETNVGISKITYYPSVTTNGNHLTLINQGSVYTDAGATTKLNGKDYKYTTSGTVNTAVPGVYAIGYTATNEDGFSASDFRTVVVISPNVAANDFSGSYARSTNSSLAVWTKVSAGVYNVFNPGGAPGTNLTVKMINYDGIKIVIPKQFASDGSLTSSASESTVAGATPGTIAKYTMGIVNGGYGTQLRTFTKQ